MSNIDELEEEENECPECGDPDCEGECMEEDEEDYDLDEDEDEEED